MGDGLVGRVLAAHGEHESISQRYAWWLTNHPEIQRESSVEQCVPIKLLFVFLFHYFMYMGVSPVCMSVYHMRVCLQRPEESAGSPGTGGTTHFRAAT